LEGPELDNLVRRVDESLRHLDAAALAGPPVSVQLVVLGATSERSWHLCIDEHGGSSAAVGVLDDATVVVHLDDETVAQLRSGALNVQRAIDAGRLKVRGDLGALARARPALLALAAALAD
jgi:hypothetical protein